MGDIIIGIAGYGTMRELVVAAIAQHDILPAITDEAVRGLYTALSSQYAGIIDIVDNALVQHDLGHCIGRWRFRNDALVGIFDHGELQVIIDAGAPEIDTGPGSGKLTVRLI